MFEFDGFELEGVERTLVRIPYVVTWQNRVPLGSRGSSRIPIMIFVGRRCTAVKRNDPLFFLFSFFPFTLFPLNLICGVAWDY